MTLTCGPFQRIYDPGVGEAEPWYINDHCFVRGRDGTWHMFGITRQEPADARNEVHLAHATAPSLTHRPWHKQPFALTADFDRHGEVHLWAPHVVEHAGVYHMYYCAGAGLGSREELDHTGYRIHLATSTDLWTWTRHPLNPMRRDGFHARDPMVLRLGDRWVMYYTATDDPAGGHHVVAAAESSDLVRWTGRRIVFTHPRVGKWGGPTESPFVVGRGGWYYLFIGPHRAYDGPDGWNGTAVYRSRDPLHFAYADEVARFDAHAVEVTRDDDDQWYVSHCGWGQGGLYLAPLHWGDD